MWTLHMLQNSTGTAGSMWPGHLGSPRDKYSQALWIAHHHYLCFACKPLGQWSNVSLFSQQNKLNLLLSEDMGFCKWNFFSEKSRKEIHNVVGFFFHFKKYKHELPRLWKKILILVRIERKTEEAALKGGDWWTCSFKNTFVYITSNWIKIIQKQ